MANPTTAAQDPDHALLQSWVQIQLDQARRARYVDTLDITATFTHPSGLDPLVEESHDYDHPTCAGLDPDTISVNGVEHLIHVFKDKICPESPYIPSFLSMRELKPLWEVYDRAILSVPKDERPEVIFIDGFGRWHERQAGLAVGFGVEREVRTIGVGKEYQPLRPDLERFTQTGEWPVPIPSWPEEDGKPHFRTKQKLFKQFALRSLQDRGEFLGIPLYKGGPLVGAAVLTAPHLTTHSNSKPAYISPGHGISLGSAISLTISCCVRKGVKLPEPIVLADRIGRDELKRLRKEGAARIDPNRRGEPR